MLVGPETQTEVGKIGWEGTGGGADTAESDKGTDDGMKMGSLRGEAAGSSQWTNGGQWERQTAMGLGCWCSECTKDRGMDGDGTQRR